MVINIKVQDRENKIIVSGWNYNQLCEPTNCNFDKYFYDFPLLWMYKQRQLLANHKLKIDN